MLKKIIGLTLALVMVLSMVQLPASAAVTNIFSATIEGRDPSATSAFIASKWYGASADFYLDSGITGRGYILRDNDKTSVTEIERSSGKKALEFVTNSSGNTIKVLGEQINYVAKADEVLRFSIDFRTADMNCEKKIVMRLLNGDEKVVLKFTSDGKINFEDKFIDTYSVDTWYEIDYYYNTTKRHCYLFINNEFVNRIYKYAIPVDSTVEYLGASWVAPAEKITTVNIDDIIVETMTPEDFASELPAYYAGFDNYSVGSYIADKVINNVTGDDKNAISRNADTNVSIYLKDENNTGDNAIKFEMTNGTAAEHFHGEANQIVGTDDIFHFGVDCKFDDRNLEKTVMLRHYNGASYSDSFDFMKFKTDGTITLWGKTVALWNTNTWYEIDVYNDKAKNLWYLYVNDEFCATVSKTLTYDKVSLVRIRWVPTTDDVASTTHIDNFNFGVVTPEYFNAILPQAPSVNSLLAVRNTVDTNSILINAAGPEMTGTLIAALYDGTELAEVKTVDAADASYVTFTKAGDNAKIMWWNGTEGDITPKVVAVPVSFAAAN